MAKHEGDGHRRAAIPRPPPTRGSAVTDEDVYPQVLPPRRGRATKVGAALLRLVVVAEHSGWTPTQRLVAMALVAAAADDPAPRFVEADDVATIAGLPPDAVRETLNELAHTGWIVRLYDRGLLAPTRYAPNISCETRR
jgi:hypothetical protein